jgi:radical SAM protein with 4Fe4S-binding SPASM domain
MNAIEHLEILQKQYIVKSIVDLDQWHSFEYSEAQNYLRQQCKPFANISFQQSERIIFKLFKSDFYVKNQTTGLILRNLQITLNETGINNAFVIVLSNNPNLHQELKYVHNLNSDLDNKITGVLTSDTGWSTVALDKHPSTFDEMYRYGSINPVRMAVNEMSSKEKFLLTESKVFCMYPWVHLNVNPDGTALPCCMYPHNISVGNAKTHSLGEIWNDTPMKKIRLNMLSEVKTNGCHYCYEKEESGFFSGRLSANKHHGHLITKVSETNNDGSLDNFEMVYWDIRYSNLCNLKCRSCGHVYSSQWYQDQSKIAGRKWAKANKVLNYAGRTETDMWEQLEPHLDYVEQIYFAGGEPLLMEEHYKILDELVSRKRFDVRLIYNTNFTHTKLKNNSVFEYWKLFTSVSIGASLDGSGAYGEYIRKGTDWAVVEQNRQEMLAVCPQIDFYISPTLSIMNAWHLPDFHKDWVERGFIKKQDLNVNILQDPAYYRIDIAPTEYKERLLTKFTDHLKWLQDQDPLNRATAGFESAIKFMMATDNTHLIDTFWRKTHELDDIRQENILEVIPELAALK